MLRQGARHATATRGAGVRRVPRAVHIEPRRVPHESRRDGGVPVLREPDDGRVDGAVVQYFLPAPLARLWVFLRVHRVQCELGE